MKGGFHTHEQHSHNSLDAPMICETKSKKLGDAVRAPKGDPDSPETDR